MRRIVIATIASACIGAVAVGGGSSVAVTHAATPTPVLTAPASSPTIPPTAATATPADLGFTWDDHQSFSWKQVQAASSYSLRGTLSAIEVSASWPLCAAPATRQTRDVTINEQLSASTTTFRVDLPALPSSDEWFVFGILVDLTAVGASGEVLASGHVGLLAETYCAPAPGTTPQSAILPNTGGQTSNSNVPLRRSAELLLLFGAAFGAAGWYVQRKRAT